jgi:outer membrane immunogenic protein
MKRMRKSLALLAIVLAAGQAAAADMRFPPPAYPAPLYPPPGFVPALPQ